MYRASRGALLGAIGGLFVAAVLTAIFEKERKLIRQVAIGGIVAVIVLIGVFFSVRQADFVQNNPTLKRFAEISWNNLNGQARQLVWPMALRGFQEKPILGWGQEGFNYVFNKYYDPGMYAQEAWFDRAHNAPLDFLVAGGILGFLSYLALFGSALYLLWLRKNTMSITERALLTGALAGYLFQAIFVFDNLVSYLLLFTTFAYIHARSTEGKEFSTRGGYLSQIISNEEYRNYILIPLVVILTGTAVYFVNVPGIKANHTLIQAFRLIQGGQPAAGLQAFKTALSYQTMGDAEIREQLLSYTPSVLRAQGIDQNLKKEFLTLTINEINKQINRVPNDARYYILMGSLLNNIGSSSEALTYIRKAVELSPRKQLMRFELINSLYTLGKYDEALAEAKSAYELDTRYDQARSLYESLSKERTKK
jgi:tetratricopeptide (TPR) repeat protein